MRVHRYSRRTIDSYLYWIKRFLTFLATERNVAAGTQALALNAIVFARPSRAIPCATPLPPIYSSPAQISVPFSSSWDTPMLKQLKSTPMS